MADQAERQRLGAIVDAAADAAKEQLTGLTDEDAAILSKLVADMLAAAALLRTPLMDNQEASMPSSYAPPLAAPEQPALDRERLARILVDLALSGDIALTPEDGDTDIPDYGENARNVADVVLARLADAGKERK